MMPKRDRLAYSLFQSGTLQNAQGIAVMDDLVALYLPRNEDNYCASVSPTRTYFVSCGVATRTLASIGGGPWSYGDP
jgi:hypothetical protein